MNLELPNEYLTGEVPEDYLEKLKYATALEFDPEEEKEIAYIFGYGVKNED